MKHNSIKVAVILAGCGRADGTEIHESVSVLVHLDRLGIAYRCFAPDLDQPEVIDHVTGKAMPPGTSKRNMLVEAARISRGEIEPIDRLHARDFGGVVFPGGFGAAKNLCDFASKGAGCTANPQVERVIKEFHAARKPIAMCCIAPVLAARVLGTASGGPGCRVTVGPEGDAARAIREMGATNVAKAVTESLVDEENLLVTTPAYMHDSGPHGVFVGIGSMIEDFAALISEVPARSSSTSARR